MRRKVLAVIGAVAGGLVCAATLSVICWVCMMVGLVVIPVACIVLSVVFSVTLHAYFAGRITFEEFKAEFGAVCQCGTPCVCEKCGNIHHE